MIEERVCEVVELKGEEVRRRLGSGYFVRSDRVLTAQHVLDGVPSLGVLPVGGPSVRAARRLWPQQASSLDLAVLGVEAVSGLPGTTPALAWGKLPLTGAWKAAGFPVAGDLVGGIGFSGLDYNHGLGRNLLQLPVLVAPAKADLWGGASGSPVFASGYLIGVLVSQLPDFDGRLLLATPLYAATGDRSFLEALGFEESQLKARSQLIAQVTGLLTYSEMAGRALAEARSSGPFAARDWLSLCEPSYRANDFAAHLCGVATLEEVLDAFNRAHHALALPTGQTSVRRAGDPAAVAMMLEALLAIIAPVVVATSRVISLPSGRGALIQLPVCTETLLELTLAGLEGRPYSFQPLENPNDFPHPEGLLQFADAKPEQGFGLNHATRLGELMKEHWDLVPSQDRHLFPREPLTEVEQLKGAVEIFDTALALQARRLDHPLRRFVLLSDLSSSADRSFVELLAENLPNLHLLHATGTERRMERELCAPLQEFLYRAQQARRVPP